MNKKLTSLILLSACALALVGCTNQAADANGNNSSSASSSLSATKPSEWPANVPVLEGAFNYDFNQLSSTYFLGYDISTTKEVADTVSRADALLMSAGWKSDPGVVAGTDQPDMKGYSNDKNQELSMSVNQSSTPNAHTIYMIVGPHDANAYTLGN